MKKHGVSLRQLHDFLKPEAGLKDLVRDVAGHFVGGIKARNRLLRATQKLTGIYLSQIERAGYDVFNPQLGRPPAFKELRVFLGSL